MKDLASLPRRNLAFLIPTTLAVLALVLQLSQVLYGVYRDRSAEEERLVLNVASNVPANYPSILAELFPEHADGRARQLPAGAVTVYLNVLVTNNSKQDVSLVSYIVQPKTSLSLRGRESSDLPEDFAVLPDGSYGYRSEGTPGTLNYLPSSLGLFAEDFTRIRLPIVIPQGHSKSFYVQTIGFLNRQQYAIAKANYPAAGVPSLIDLVQTLNEEVPGLFNVRAPTNSIAIDYSVAFVTGRGLTVEASVVNIPDRRRSGPVQ